MMMVVLYGCWSVVNVVVVVTTSLHALSSSAVSNLKMMSLD